MGTCTSSSKSGAGGPTVTSNWKQDINFNEKSSFFGNISSVSKKYFVLESQNPSEDEAIIFTNNVRVIKGNPVLITDNNKAVYLKDFNIQKTSLEFPDRDGEFTHKEIIDTFAVKVNKKYFKEYTFQNDFEGISFDKPTTFDEIKKIAKTQEKQNKRVSTHQLIIGRNGFIE